MAPPSGGFSVKELENIFGVRVASELAKESPTGEVGSADITLWCVTFRKIIEQGIRGYRGGDMTPPHSRKGGATGSVTMPVKDQLYKLFQKILKIPYTVHQVLYRECQVGVVFVLLGGGGLGGIGVGIWGLHCYWVDHNYGCYLGK